MILLGLIRYGNILFFQIEATEGVVGVTDEEMKQDEIVLNEDSSVFVENIVQ